MRGLTIAALLVMAFAAPSVAVAESNQTSAYYCTAEVAGGLKYDEVQQKWVGTSFHNDNQFVVRLNLLRTYVQKEEHLRDEPMKVYEVTITPRGENHERPCVSSSGKEVSVVAWANIVGCDAYALDYKINLNLNRYLMTYSVGYAVAVGEHGEYHAETPFVEGGICTKIE
jgi:hypothetical protein